MCHVDEILLTRRGILGKVTCHDFLPMLLLLYGNFPSSYPQVSLIFGGDRPTSWSIIYESG